MPLNAEQAAAVDRMNRATAEARALGTRPASKYALEKAAAEAGYPVSEREMLGTAGSMAPKKSAATDGSRHSVLGVMFRHSWLGKLIWH